MTRPQLLEGFAGKEGGDFFRGGGAIFNLRSEIFNDKKSLYAKIFYWEILTKNLVTFKILC